MSGSLNVISVPNVDPNETWSALEYNRDAVLIDVRTAAEWTFVGVPNLMSLAKAPVFVEWQTYPGMAINRAFVGSLTSTLTELGKTRECALYFLCRSGARSKSAAEAMIDAGWNHSFNVEGGFEGGPDATGKRGTVNGWKASGLPWSQS